MADEISLDQVIAKETAKAVDFKRDVLPILARRCALCHSEERSEGGFNLATRETFLQGGDSGYVAEPGRADESLLLRLVEGREDDRIMPAKGPRLTTKQATVLRRWIDLGMPWEDGVSITPSMGLASLELRKPVIPESPPDQSANPIDRLLQPYFASQGIVPGEVVSDRVFARRVYRDLIGLLPTPEQIAALEQDSRPDKRDRLVRELLQDRTNYALHWMTFWNDALRNTYRGTGFIDKKRTQITGWLFAALYDNLPYDEFVRELIAPTEESKGFVKGIVWRGVVNASQRQELQAAQSISQVFLGINLKCASCHDSFVDPWKLSDAYGLAAVFAEKPLDIHECDKPNGEVAAASFLFPQLGSIDMAASAEDRQRELAALVTSPNNGRFSRTIVNRLWDRFFGRGIIAALDNVDGDPFHPDLLDWLAADFVENGYDLQHTIYLICTSRAYQSTAVPLTSQSIAPEAFQGPLVRRMSAEQFVDAISQLTQVWQPETKEMTKTDGRGQGGQLTSVRKVLKNRAVTKADKLLLRAVLVDADSLMASMGRSNREQVVTRRDSISTPLEALEATNGQVLDRMLRDGAEKWMERSLTSAELVDAVYLQALGRKPLASELEVAVQLIGSPATVDGVQDLLWTIVMLPEFQFIE